MIRRLESPRAPGQGGTGAGQGFRFRNSHRRTVVTSEPKDLAQETARVAEDVSWRVAAIQADAQSAAASTSEIAGASRKFNQRRAAAVPAEEQTAITGETSGNIASSPDA
ncbi:hypothetical protein [Actinoplanes sp. HUAS TT8]|uniref:hypothetical protein n=1 Tax=Actinoplanes sp. HUAS TT8 TaxID=3447453 RepID=UPI003F51E104